MGSSKENGSASPSAGSVIDPPSGAYEGVEDDRGTMFEEDGVGVGVEVEVEDDQAAEVKCCEGVWGRGAEGGGRLVLRGLLRVSGRGSPGG